ncbi:MAG: heavy-metal-associated domain-containing protein [Planctomycetota bacterium]
MSRWLMTVFGLWVLPAVLAGCATTARQEPASVAMCCSDCVGVACCADLCCGDASCGDCAHCEACSKGEAVDGDVAVITAAGMSCPLCAANIDRQLARIDGFEAMQMNLETGELFVTFDGTAKPTDARLTQAIADAGFTVESVRWEASTTSGDEVSP